MRFLWTDALSLVFHVHELIVCAIIADCLFTDNTSPVCNVINYDKKCSGLILLRYAKRVTLAKTANVNLTDSPEKHSANMHL